MSKKIREQKYFVAGGAGFIGSHLVRRLLREHNHATVTVYDNFSSGREWHLAEIIDNPRLQVLHGEIRDLEKLTIAMEGAEVVFHLASNPDIAKALTKPDIDFWQGTYLTQNILEAMRVNEVKRIIYASGSGVYGEVGSLEVHEDHGPMLPISTYAASKLAGEALACSYCYMFGLIVRTYRFANVVGPRQTHGVGYDFIHRLKKDPTRLQILGDGMQSKSYIYVDDVLDAIFWTDPRTKIPYDCFNVATGDYITVREIAEIVIDEMNLTDVQIEYTGGDRGWKGDVPLVRFALEKINGMGWQAKLSSKEAIRASIQAMLQDL